MNASEIFPRLPTETADRIFSDLLAADKAGYRTVMHTLATRRKLRPVYLERKSRPDRHAWMAEDLGRMSNYDMAENVLHSWLLLRHRKMICAFLDSLQIPHDGEGMLETLPSEPDVDKIQAAINTLFTSYDPSACAIYLHVFNAMDIAGWKTLDTIFSEDARFHFSASPSLS